MTIEERLADLEDQQRTLAVEHTALQFVFLSLYPIGQTSRAQLEAAFTSAHVMAERGMREGGADDEFRRGVSESIESLSDALFSAMPQE